MAHVAPIYPSFSKGEVSPLMFGRIDIEQYNTCLDKCRNMWIRPYGCASRVTGTEYIAQAKNDGKARLLKFVFSAADSFIIECGAGYFRFYKDGKPILIENADFYDKNKPYKVGNYVNKDTTGKTKSIEKCIKEHTPTDDTETNTPEYWEKVTDIKQAYEIENDYQEEQLSSIQYVQLDDIIKLTCLPVGDDYSTARPKELLRRGLTAWEYREVEFKETPYLDQNITDIKLTPSAATGDSITLKASEEFFRQEHVGANFWLGIPVLDSDSNENVQGYVKVIEWIDSKQVKAKVMSKLSGTSATKIWGESAFSDYRGYPSCVALYDGRLFYARTPHHPRNIYGSVPYAYEKFTPAVDNEDDGAINVQLATNANGDGSDIKWIIGGAYLLCGTYGGEFIIRGTGDGAITPTDISAKQRTNWGGENVRPVVAGSFIHFLQRTGKKLRQFQYDYYYDSYKAVDLSIYSEHLLSSPIKQMAYQKAPDSIIYLMREDGQVVMLSLEQDQSVMAWSLLEDMSGQVESIETIPTKDGLFDEVWLLMKRNALATTLKITSSNDKLEIENNYNQTLSSTGIVINNLKRTGSGVTFSNSDDKSYIGYYIRNGYLCNSSDVVIDNECGWTKLSHNRGIKNGKLYLISGSNLTIIDDTGNWEDISGSGSSSSVPYLGIKDGKLYLVGNTTDTTEVIDNETGWTKVVNFNTTNYVDYFKYGIKNGKLFYIKLDKTFEQIGSLENWTHITADTKGDDEEFAYGIAGGSLYKLNGATATKIGSSTTWTDVIGTSDSSTAALGISDGELYAIKNTTVTLLAGGSYKWTSIGNDLNLYSSTPSYYTPAVANGVVYAIGLSSSGSKVIKAISKETGYTDVWGVLETNTTRSNCYAIKDGNLYKVYYDGRTELIGEADASWVDENNKIYDLEKDFNVVIKGDIKYTDTLTLTFETTEKGFNRYIERMKNPVTSENAFDWWYVRNGQKHNSYELTKDITLTLTVKNHEITATTSDNYFTEEMLNKSIRTIDDNYNTLNEYVITQINNEKEVVLSTNGLIENTLFNGGSWGVGVTSINGLDRLNELEVVIFADAKEQSNKTVHYGSIELDKESFVVLVGLPYQSYMTTMPLEQGSQNGTAVGKRKRIGEIAIRVWNSQGIRYGRDLDNLYETIQNQSEPFTGIIPNIKYNQGWGWTANITLEQSKPYPMNVLAIAPIVTEVDK